MSFDGSSLQQFDTLVEKLDHVWVNDLGLELPKEVMQPEL